jgi:hypothetical protein
LFLLSVIGAVADEIVGEGMPDSYSWRYTTKALTKPLAKLVFPWKEAVEVVLPLISGVIRDNTYNATRDFGKVPDLANQVSSIINGAGATLTNRFAPLRDVTEW